MDEKNFLNHLDELFELESGSVTAGDVLEDISGWESLTFIGLIALLDEQYGVVLAPDELLQAKTAGGLLLAVQERMGGASRAA